MTDLANMAAAHELAELLSAIRVHLAPVLRGGSPLTGEEALRLLLDALEKIEYSLRRRR
jgi:hypothetical protein